MERLELKGRLGFALVRLLGAIVLTAGCVQMIRTGRAAFAAWFFALFFGAGTVMSLKLLLDRRSQLIIDENGIYCRRWGFGPVPWSEIRDFDLLTLHHQTHLLIWFHRPELFLGKRGLIQKIAAAINWAVGAGDIACTLSGLDAPPEQVLELCMKLKARSG